MIKNAVAALVKGQDLDYGTAYAAMNEIMSGEVSEVTISAYLTALAAKGESATEIAASAAAMRSKSEKLPYDGGALEIVGTGGDRSDSFNISTASAIVAAAGGVPVAKHGNRAASSRCGAADVLECLGVNLNLSPEASARLLRETGICFLFAQRYHTAMKYVAAVRRELGIRTVFNILGPLANPAGADMQLLGVYSPDLVQTLARALRDLGVRRAMTVYGTDGLDEISVCAPTRVCELKGGELIGYDISPTQFGLPIYEKGSLKGGTPKENAHILREVLSGGERGAKRAAVLLNAGAALYIADRCGDISDGVRYAAEIIDGGLAAKKLDEFIARSSENI